MSQRLNHARDLSCLRNGTLRSDMLAEVPRVRRNVDARFLEVRVEAHVGWATRLRARNIVRAHERIESGRERTGLVVHLV
jgi:hypothetical protein